MSRHTADRAPLARREQLVSAAAHEFRAKDFAGSASTTSAAGRCRRPGLSRYFDTEAEILFAAVTRLHEWLVLEMTCALRTSGSDDPGIALAVWLTERVYLPDAGRERMDRIQADYLVEW